MREQPGFRPLAVELFFRERCWVTVLPLFLFFFAGACMRHPSFFFLSPAHGFLPTKVGRQSPSYVVGYEGFPKRLVLASRSCVGSS